jgi:hypothetical protein
MEMQTLSIFIEELQPLNLKMFSEYKWIWVADVAVWKEALKDRKTTFGGGQEAEIASVCSYRDV